MLTGDKVETAETIGHSSGLLDDDKQMRKFNIVQTAIEEIESNLNQIEREIVEVQREKTSILVSGESLGIIQSSETLTESFVSVAIKADVVLACRVSPKQKADIVQMIRLRFPNKSTLAIGDGANDVSMIASAHVGVGIMGLEGSQAARCADFAIG